MKPRLLDLFCGAGGAAKGYQRAGFHVTGVDIAAQPHYCGDEFVQDEALKFVADLEWHGIPHPEAFVAIHASPPCQAYTHARWMANRGRDDHPRLIEPIRGLLKETGLPYVIENVEGAPLDRPVVLCGTSFGLDVKRHRLFECSFPVLAPPCGCGGHRPKRFVSTPRIDGSRPLSAYVNPQASETTHDELAEAMGIDWMPARGKRPSPELHEAIPPAYTTQIGECLMAELKAKAAA